MELIGKCGNLPPDLTYRDLRSERSNGYLKVFSVAVDEIPHRIEFTDRGSSVAILPVDFERKELYLIQTPRAPRAFARDGAAVDWIRKLLKKFSVPTAITVPGEQINLWEACAGMIEESDATPLVAGARELLEEMGIKLADEAFTELCPVTLSIGGSTELSYLFIAKVTERVEKVAPKGDGTENIEVWRLSFDEACVLVQTNRMVTATSRILILSLFLDLAKRQTEQERKLRLSMNGG